MRRGRKLHEGREHARSPVSRALFYLVLASLSVRADFWGEKGQEGAGARARAGAWARTRENLTSVQE